MSPSFLNPIENKQNRFILCDYRDKYLTPEIPEDCPEKLRELMQMCWKKEPQQRPVSSLSSSTLFVCFERLL
jgi:hypothetical protein